MFLVINKKKFLISLIIFILIFSSIGVFFAVKATSTPKQMPTIVLDAGHGGRDGGCTGVNTGVKESDLALSITKKLESYLKIYGYNVVLTRKDANGLYGEGADNKKQDDMAKRKKIISKSNASLVVSIHLNSFPSDSAKGAQAFYNEKSETGKTLSTDVQEQLALQIPGARKVASSADYYILNCSSAPSVLVECGYLSNAEEEALLITDQHQEKIAYAIFCGILKFFNASFS